ncbi:hypothetical protein [Dictyobacter formicarum]|uniref:Fibronectin type-III domain-containing protein n=1 Tax=Dictyobacter formicarum TaxID=2778368 RepID=A0ABQ3VGP1_9CHLR|nr:hypothetical protein [Dictyobacter formicarum]GHO84973.1 hypothetical protein KSZ_29790 [Dictyobacter formicarum]
MKRPSFFTLVAILSLLSLLIVACGNPIAETQASTTPASTKTTFANRMDQSITNVDRVPSPTATAAAQNVPDPTPTVDPMKTLTISWNAMPSTIYTVGVANVRSIPFTGGYIIKTVAAAQALTVYGTVNGENFEQWTSLVSRLRSNQYAPIYL